LRVLHTTGLFVIVIIASLALQKRFSATALCVPEWGGQGFAQSFPDKM
jgi:hypothetical protein